MNIDLAALPADVDTLHRMIGDLAAALDSERTEAQAEIERLRRIVKMLQRSRFGRRSERLDDDQLQLGLEDLDADLPPKAPGKEPKRRPICRRRHPAKSASAGVYRTTGPACPIICRARM